MPSRIGAAQLPRVRRVDMNHQPRRTVFSAPLLAMTERIARGEQCMGQPTARGCPGAALPGLRLEKRLPALQRTPGVPQDRPQPAPLPPLRLCRARARACPGCGSPTSSPWAGTEQPRRTTVRLMEGAARTAARARGTHRRDSTCARGRCPAEAAQVHAGEVDAGGQPQMIAKRLRAHHPGGGGAARRRLVLQRFPGARRLLALLMQAAGRVGATRPTWPPRGTQCEMWVQSFHPGHAVFAEACTHDYLAFAAQQLKEREEAAMPPFAFQALVRADARTQEVARFFRRRQQRRAGPRAARGGPRSRSPAGAAYHPARGPGGARPDAGREQQPHCAAQRFLAAWQPVLQATPATSLNTGGWCAGWWMWTRWRFEVF